MRNLSFALTTQQMRDRSKTVTRRKGTFWAKALRPGDLVCAVEKSQGVKRGGIVRLGVIRIVSVRVEPLDDIRWCVGSLLVEETTAEGFPGMNSRDFVSMFIRHMGGDGDQIVTRIEFEHTDLPVPGGAK